MPKSGHRNRRRQPKAYARVTASRENQALVPKNIRDERSLINRILDTPHLATVVPQLQPEMLHAVIQTCGLEDCTDIVAMATPAQLERVFDLDLWRAARPGVDDQIDPDRFGKWLDVLMECGAAVAAQKLAGIDAELVIAALAQHLRVFDHAAISMPSVDGEEMPERRSSDGPVSCEIGGYVIEAKRPDFWDAIVTLLPTLDADHPDYFHRVMVGCRRLSNSGREIDGLDDLLDDTDQDMFDLGVDREQRREKQGYVMPAQARAFLQSARQLQLGSDTPPPRSPLARAYFRGMDRTPLSNRDAIETSGSTPGDHPCADAVAAIVEIIGAAGGKKRQPRALLEGESKEAPRISRVQAHMDFTCEVDHAAYEARSEEFAYLANALVAGGSIQGRAFTPREASDAAAAVCNLGLENWPDRWLHEPPHRSAEAGCGTVLPENFLVSHDLISVFHVGWSVLHTEVTMKTAERLIHIVSDLQSGDAEVHAGLDALRFELTKQWLAGTPWCAREALDVLLILDQLAWATLLGLISEYPVIHAGLAAARLRTHAVDASAFEFICENRQISAVNEFMDSLPQTLRVS